MIWGFSHDPKPLHLASRIDYFQCFLVTGLSMVWVVYSLRARQIAKAISVRFDERLAERTRIARDFHDTHGCDQRTCPGVMRARRRTRR